MYTAAKKCREQMTAEKHCIDKSGKCLSKEMFVRVVKLMEEQMSAPTKFLGERLSGKMIVCIPI